MHSLFERSILLVNHCEKRQGCHNPKLPLQVQHFPIANGIVQGAVSLDKTISMVTISLRKKIQAAHHCDSLPRKMQLKSRESNAQWFIAG